MNQKQIDLIKSITNQMIKPIIEMMTSDEHTDVINEDGGEYASLVISIMSSIMATVVSNFINELDKNEDESMSDYEKMIGMISIEALNARYKKDKQRGFH